VPCFWKELFEKDVHFRGLQYRARKHYNAKREREIMPKFNVPLIVTIEAEDYESAFNHAVDLAEGMGYEGYNISAQHRENLSQIPIEVETESLLKVGDRVSTDCGYALGTVVDLFCDGSIARVRWDELSPRLGSQQTDCSSSILKLEESKSDG
jgi:hypothetical protein